MRLTSLDQVPAALRPGYAPADHGVGIVHLGLGAFHKAHQAALTDLALAATGGDRYHAFSLIGFLLGIQLLFSVLFGGSRDWVADIAGFGAGFVLSFLVSPGGWGRVRQRIRHR